MNKFIKVKNQSREMFINIDYITRLYIIENEYFVDVLWDINHFYSVSEDDYYAILNSKVGENNDR